MNQLHPIFQHALAPFAPPPLTAAEREAIDRAMHQDKLNDGYAKRHQAQALAWQIRTESRDYQ